MFGKINHFPFLQLPFNSLLSKKFRGIARMFPVFCAVMQLCIKDPSKRSLCVRTSDVGLPLLSAKKYLYY